MVSKICHPFPWVYSTILDELKDEEDRDLLFWILDQEAKFSEYLKGLISCLNMPTNQVNPSN